MSVLINMEMPTSCRACPMKMNCDDCEGWECVCVPLHEQIGYLDELLTDKRRDDCPLVPVPPHGRLIDADALDIKRREEQAWHDYERNPDNEYLEGVKDGLHEAAKQLSTAPTIIPASEEGE